MSSETPFHLITKMESALALVDNCLQQIELCCKLHKKLTKLNECERKGDSTRVMLILAKYRSRARFLDRIANAANEFDRKSESLETHVKEMKEILEAKSYRCPQCYGRGSLSKYEYIRGERGSVRPILRSHTCDNCKGAGTIAIPSVAETYLSLFLEMANKLILFQKHFRNVLNILNTEG